MLRGTDADDESLVDRTAFSNSDTFVLKGDLLLQLLEFLASTISDLTAPVDKANGIRIDKSNEGGGISPEEDNQLHERLKLVETQVLEGLWRARTFHSLIVSDSSRSRRLAQSFSMAHVVAPLHYLAAYLLQRDRLDDARAQLPMPALPQSLSVKAMDRKSMIMEGVETASTIAEIQAIQSARAASEEASTSNAGGDDTQENASSSTSSTSTTTTSHVHVNRSLQSLVGIHNDLASQRDHASRLIHDADTWEGLKKFIKDSLNAAAQLEATRAAEAARAEGVRAGVGAAAKGRSILKSSSAPSVVSNLEIVSAPAPQDSPVEPKKFAAAVARYIEQHCRSRVPTQPPEEDEILERKYLLSLDAAVTFAQDLTVEQYQAFVDVAIQAAERLKVFYQTVLLARFSEPAFASADAILSVAATSREEAARAVEGQKMLREDLRARIELCDMYIYFAQRRRTTKDDVATQMIPAALHGEERVPPQQTAILALHGVHVSPVPVSPVDYFDAWRKYMARIAPPAYLPSDDPDQFQDPTQNDLPDGPWTSQVAVQVVRYLAEAAAKDAFIAQQKRLKNSPNLIAALASIPQTGATAGLSLIDPVVAAAASDGTIDASISNMDDRSQALLARAMLPALAAVRFAMPAAIDALLEGNAAVLSRGNPLHEAIAIATEYSKFLPTFAQWVEWRSRAYQRVATWIDLLVRPGMLVSRDPDALVQNVKSLIARENAYRDAQAYTDMFMSYIDCISIVANSGGQSRIRQLTAMRLAALELADEVLDSPQGRDKLSMQHLGDPVKSTQSVTANLDKYVEELLKDIVFALTDSRQQPLRAQLITRIKDPVTASEFALQWLPLWPDTEMSAAVALSCFSSLAAYVPTLELFIQKQTAKIISGKKGASLQQIESSKQRLEVTIRLRDALALDYQYILIYRALEAAAKENSRARELAFKASQLGKEAQGVPPPPAGPSPSEEDLSIYKTWADLKRAAKNDLEGVIFTLLRWRQFSLAVMLFNMQMGASSDCSSIHSLTTSVNIQAVPQVIPQGVDPKTAATERLFKSGRWWFGQDLVDGAGPGAATGLAQASAAVQTVDRGSQLMFPLEIFESWAKLMEQMQLETGVVPEEFGSESRALRGRCAIRLESACIAALLSKTSSARNRLRGIQRVRKLCTPVFNEIMFNIIRYLMLLLDYPQSRLLVMETLHKHWTSFPTASVASMPATTLYSRLPPTQAMWLQSMYAASQMLVMLPHKVQLDICNVMGAGLQGFGEPAHIIEGLLRLDQPALVMALLPRFKSVIRVKGLLRTAVAICVGRDLEPESGDVDGDDGEMKVDIRNATPEIGLYFFDLCVQFEEYLPLVASSLLTAVEALLPNVDLANRLIIQKLLKYFYVYCYETASSTLQSQYHSLARDAAAGTANRLEDNRFVREAAIVQSAPIAARGRRASLDGTNAPTPTAGAGRARRGSVDGASPSPGPQGRRRSIDGRDAANANAAAAATAAMTSTLPPKHQRRRSIDGGSSPFPGTPGRERKGSDSGSQQNIAAAEAATAAMGRPRSGSASSRRGSGAGNTLQAAAAATAAMNSGGSPGNASPQSRPRSARRTSLPMN